MATATETQGRAQVEERTKQPWLWNVVLLNDDDHSYEYVVQMVQTVFAHGKEKAYLIAKTVDTQARAICLTTHKEHAELKRDQILAFGPDPTDSTCKGSMSAVIEPAEFSGEGDDLVGKDGEEKK